MVSDEVHAAVVAEKQHLSEQLTAALARITELKARITALEAKKPPPPSFVKANQPVRRPGSLCGHRSGAFGRGAAAEWPFVDQPANSCHTLARRRWHFQRELLTCVRLPAVPADNNSAEWAIRPWVVTRKISEGTRSARARPPTWPWPR